LGFGTQLGLSVAAGLNAYLGLPQPPIWELAHSAGRGLRSAVGTHGFAHGGLLFERGKLPTELISPLERRVPLPSEWRFVLVCPRERRGLYGPAERQAFSELPPVPQEVADGLSCEVRERMLPAAEQGDPESFGESVYQYGYRAGSCFAGIQGGAYNGSQLERLVELIRSLGIRGVGQSSWGPTIFALCPDASRAERLVDELRQHRELETADIWLTAPRNSGAEIRVIAEDGELE